KPVLRQLHGLAHPTVHRGREVPASLFCCTSHGTHQRVAHAVTGTAPETTATVGHVVGKALHRTAEVGPTLAVQVLSDTRGNVVSRTLSNRGERARLVGALRNDPAPPGTHPATHTVSEVIQERLGESLGRTKPVASERVGAAGVTRSERAVHFTGDSLAQST